MAFGFQMELNNSKKNIWYEKLLQATQCKILQGIFRIQCKIFLKNIILNLLRNLSLKYNIKIRVSYIIEYNSYSMSL